MPTKSTKTATKSESKKSKLSEKKSISKISENKSIEKKESTKKVVVKRRKTDLKPTKASAVAIVSQANRAKKKALIEKFATEQKISYNKTPTDNSKIPLWARVFFGCSLLLFCISFYIAVFRQQIENDFIDNGETSDVAWLNWENSNFENSSSDNNLAINNPEDSRWDDTTSQKEITNPTNPTETIQAFFDNLSNRNFDSAFDLMIPVLRSSSEIREHFTSFRMDPFLDWIEWWKLIPENIELISSTPNWKDRYGFDLSYVMTSNQEKYDETWEFVINTAWDEPKISSIVCKTSKCSYHPIFWPENFGLLR